MHKSVLVWALAVLLLASPALADDGESTDDTGATTTTDTEAVTSDDAASDESGDPASDESGDAASDESDAEDDKSDAEDDESDAAPSEGTEGEPGSEGEPSIDPLPTDPDAPVGDTPADSAGELPGDTVTEPPIEPVVPGDTGLGESDGAPGDPGEPSEGMVDPDGVVKVPDADLPDAGGSPVDTSVAGGADSATDDGVAGGAESAGEAGSADIDVARETAVEPSGDGPSFQSGGLAGAGVVVGLKVGGGFGQVFSEFGSSFVGELELGYNFPFHDRNLGLYVTGSYAGPSTDGESQNVDPRLPGDGIMSYEITQHQAIIGIGLIYRIPVPVDIFRPYISAGTRIHLMRTDVTGSAGDLPFGDNEETGTSVGGGGALGGELYLGPGALLLELQTYYAPADGFVIRNSNVGSLNVALGYRLFI